MQNNTGNCLTLPESHCPFCHRNSKAAMVSLDQPPENVPKPGDFVLCTFCNTPLIFDQLMFRRRCDTVELQSFWKQHPYTAYFSAQVRLATYQARHAGGFAEA